MNTTKVLQLDNFNMTKLNISWENTEVEPVKHHINVGYALQRNKESENVFKLFLKLNCDTFNEKGDTKTGFSIEAEICGIFAFPEGFEESTTQYLIRVNGLTILYGILRGQLSLCTGSFPGGKFNLPTLNMHEIVMEIEKEQLNKQEESKQEEISIPSESAKE